MSWRWLWPWGRKHREPSPSPELVQAREKLAEVKSKDHEVLWLAGELRRIRETNNFAALLGQAFRDRR